MRVVTLDIFETMDTSCLFPLFLESIYSQLISQPYRLRNGSRNLDLRRALCRNHLRLFTHPSTPATDSMLFLLVEYGSFRWPTGKL